MDEMVYLGPIDLSQYFVKETLMTEYEVPPNVAAIKVKRTRVGCFKHLGPSY